MPITSYKDLTVWQKSIDLVNEIYVVTKKLPKTETFGLISQMQRSAVAIPSNIAEGFGRKGSKEFIQFLHIALGSLLELETQLLITEKQYKLKSKIAENLLLEIQKMLRVLIKRIETAK